MLKKNFIRLMYLLLMVLSIVNVSCSDEDGQQSEVLTEVRFKIAVEDSVSTRSTQNSTFEKGDAIGVFAFVRDDNSVPAKLQGDYANNRKWVWNGIEFLPETEADKIFFSGSRKMDFYVYYPYSESNNSYSDIAFQVSSDQTSVTGYNASDFMTAVNTTGIFNQAVELDFHHKLSTLRLMVEDLGNITGATASGLMATSLLDFSKNSAVASGNTTSLKMYNRGSISGLYTFDVCVPVQTLPIEKILFTVHRTGADDVNIKATAGMLQEGKITTLNVPLMKTITITQTTGGVASGAGTYPYGYDLTVMAKPQAGYSFIGWYEGGNQVSTLENYSFKVTKDRVLEPRYERIVYHISVVKNIDAGGTVTGGGDFYYNDGCTLSQTANTGYTFNGWFEGGNPVSTNSTYTFNVTSSRSFEARYTINRYTLTVVNGSGSGTYDYGTNVTIKANDIVGHTFSRWSDGNTNATRTVTVTGNATYTAEYTTNKYTLTVVNGSGSGTYDYGTNVTIKANTIAGKTFSRWSDGNTNATRTVTVTGNATYTAEYTTNKYTLTVVNGSGSGTYDYGTNVTIQANVIAGKTFSRWSDGNTNATRTVTVTGNATYTAEYTSERYTLTVNSNNASYGTTFGSGTYDYGTNVTIQAIPKAASGNISYSFVKWNDGDTNSSRIVTVTTNVTYTATFRKEEWLYSISVSPTSLNFSSKGGTKSFTVTSTRTKYVDGVSSTTENVGWTAQLTGGGAGAFSVEGSNVKAAENSTSSLRSATLLISQTGGGSASISLEQDGKFDVDVDIE